MMRLYRSFAVVLVALAMSVAGAFVPVRFVQGPSGQAAPVAASALALVAAPAAHAQRARKRSLMSILFGRRDARRRAVKRRSGVQRRRTVRRKKRARKVRKAKRPARVQRRTARAKPKKRKQRRRAVVRRKAPAAAAAAVAGTAAAATSEEDVAVAPAETKKVLVIGDFYAGGLAFGLERNLDESTGIVVDKRTVASSGLVREDVVDWPERIPELVAEAKPDYIVLQIGSNDRQLMRTPGGNFKPREGGWDESYKARIDKVAAALKATNVPFLWVGVPPVRFKSMNRDFLVFNEWYAEAAKAAGGKFVDVWDGFSDADGNYVRSGPNVAGQIVVLRGKDGINMTNRGKDKLGWYAAEPVAKALEGPRVFTELPTFNLGSPEIAKQVYNPARTGRTVVVKLDDPTVDGVEGLAGAGELKPAVPVLRDAAPAGRADDFSWPAGR